MPDDFPSSPLTPSDAEALNALVEAGFNPEAAPPALRARARRVAEILGLLDEAAPAPASDSEVVSRPSLIDLTMTRVARAPAPAPVVHESNVALARADVSALDALVAAGWDSAQVSAEHQARAERVAFILRPLEQRVFSSSEREDLVAETMATVWRHRDAAADLMPTFRAGWRLRDLGALAAAVLLAISIIWPVAASMRAGARRDLAQAGLHSAGLAFSLYANDHRGELPRTEASASTRGATSWWEVGARGRSHSANLFVLVKHGYADLGDLASPGNPYAPVKLDLERHDDWRASREVSYSYQLFSDRTPMWSGGETRVILADRSPIVDRARRGESFDPWANSLNFQGLGQHLLRSDGSVEWRTSPVLADGDNLWLPAWLDARLAPRLHGAERPVSPTDAFVGP